MAHKNIRLLAIFNFLMEFSLYGPVAILYFSDVAGSYALGASILSIVMLASSLFEVPTGIWSDRVGRKQTIIAGSWSRVISVVCYAVGGSYAWLVLGAILEGLSRSFYSGNNDALLHDTLTDAGKQSEYGHYLGRVTAYEHVAVALGSVIGGIIASFSYGFLFWLSVLPQLAKVVISYQFIEPKARSLESSNVYKHTLDALKMFVKNKKLRLLSFTDTFGFATGEAVFQFRNTFIASVWPIWGIGFLDLAVHTLAAMGYYFSRKIIGLVGPEKLLFIRTIVGKITVFLAIGINNVLSPIFFILPSLIYGAGEVAKSTLLQREFTEHQRATMSSLNSLAKSLGFAIVTVFLGLFADKTSPIEAIGLITLISLPMIPLNWVIFRRRNS